MVLLIFCSLIIFGRAFCGWACHLRSLVELGDWCLRRTGLGERRPNNSTHPWLFRGVALYIVLLPAGLYLAAKGFHPSLSLLEPSPLSNLPATGSSFFHKTAPINWALSEFSLGTALCSALAVITILFSMTLFLSYFYGPGAFCRTICPYATLFGAIVKTSNLHRKITRIRQCTGCRDCSNACPQGIDVNREIFFRAGKVVSADRIKCMACVDACDHAVLSDTTSPAVPQTRKIPAYERDATASIASMQSNDKFPLWAEAASLILSNVIGAALSFFGAFFYFAGLSLGFVVSRIVLKRLLRASVSL